MTSRTFGRISVTLPDLADGYLSNVASLEGGRGTVQDFNYADTDLRDLDLANARLLTGRITNLHASRVRLIEVRIDSVEFNGCDLGNLQWVDSKLSRVVFRNCKLMASNISGLTLDNVLFDNCKLDYSTFEKVRATGPLAFARCVLTESTFTGCDLTASVFNDCTLRDTEFGRGTYKATDLRGNDLTALRGIGNLTKVVIDRAQQIELTQALMTELDVTFGDDLDETEPRRAL
ncbi:pentapeptide repeat-containing protein [Kitasatospora sp. NPDC056531]|uniref:pentapeptide repeat-containing protein n=1 Tax=Kitasatospora sp. NPDC056531 TaxID=3345856 RepID=UPI0036C873DA